MVVNTYTVEPKEPSPVARLSMFPYPNVRPSIADDDWITGPVGLTAISKALERANYNGALRRLYEIDPKGLDHESIRWTHWAVGFQEEVFVRPDSECAKLVSFMRQDLMYYPCLDDDLLAEYEAEEKAEKAKAKAIEEETAAKRREQIIAAAKARAEAKGKPGQPRQLHIHKPYYQIDDGKERPTPVSNARKTMSKWEKKQEAKKEDNANRLWASEQGHGEFGGEGG